MDEPLFTATCGPPRATGLTSPDPVTAPRRPTAIQVPAPEPETKD